MTIHGNAGCEWQSAFAFALLCEGAQQQHLLCCNRLWDMVDEFIYQFQSFAQYRGKLAQKSPHELELLKKCDGVWDLQGVLHYLQGLIDKSNIVQVLSSDGALSY